MDTETLKEFVQIVIGMGTVCLFFHVLIKIAKQ